VVAIKRRVFRGEKRFAHPVRDLRELYGVPLLREELGDKCAIFSQYSRNSRRLIILNARQTWKIADKIKISPSPKERRDTAG
jgi:hypothetical protein